MQETVEPIVVFLRDTVTGYKKDQEFEGTFAGDELDAYVWRDGNFSCDCNRSIFLWGMEDKELPCGDGRIVVDKIVRVKTGATAYQEAVAP